jgi:integrase/recombinase XerD
MDLIEKGAKISLYLDTRRPKEDDIYPVKLRVYFGKARLFDTGKSLSQDDFDKSYLTKKPKGEYKDLKISLAAIEAKANEVIKELKTFSFDKFEKQLFKTQAGINNVIDRYQSYIDQLEANEQIGTASNYRCSITSIQAFVNDGRKNPVNKIAFESITPEFLNRYEQWMINKEKSKTTVGIYLRPLRKIFNEAIEGGEIDRETYPFKTYKIPTGKNVKKALEPADLKNLYTAKVSPGSFIEKARDFWFFSYQCNGMNFRDIAELKFKNIHDTYFSFLRHKTINTTKEDPTPIVVPLTSYITDFIHKYGNKKGKPNDYVFPIFQVGITAKERHRINQNFIRFVNQHMQKLVEELGLSIKLGTMVARHTFTTRVTRTLGLEFAQEALGHTTMATTQNYWKGFEQVAKKEMADKLMDFITTSENNN